jgi:hypothetical protein
MEMLDSSNHSKNCCFAKKEKKLLFNEESIFCEQNIDDDSKCKCCCNKHKCKNNCIRISVDCNVDSDCTNNDCINNDCDSTNYKCNSTKYDCLDSCLRTEFRKLWSEHAIYTKFYINSVLGNIPDAKLIAARLLRNQVDIGNFTKQFTGESKGNILARLLQQHILAAANAVNAVKSGKHIPGCVTWERFIRSGKQQAITDAVNKVFQNSRKVSHFISNLNPCKLPFKVVLHHFNQHNQYVIDMSLTRKNGDFEKDIQIFDTYYTQLLDFADLFLNGLVDGC